MSAVRIRLLAAIGVVGGAWAALALPRHRKRSATNVVGALRPSLHGTGMPSATRNVKSSDIANSVLALPGPLRPSDNRQSTAPAPQPLRQVDGVRTRHNTDMASIRGALGYGKELFRRFGTDECGSWAASLSFFAILSIAPILLCGLALLGFFYQNPEEAARSVHRIVANIVPDRAAANALIEQLNIKAAAATLIHSAPRAALIGILSLIWSSLQIFVNAVAPMNAAFRATETRNWLRLRVSALVLLLVTGALFLASLVPTSGVALIGHLGLGHLPDPIPPILAVIFFVIGMVLNGLTVSVIYMYLPSPTANVSWRAALTAGAIVAVLSEIAKQAFSIYLQKFANYNKVYGSLGGLIAIIFWTYYSSMILLLGAEIAQIYQDNLDYRAKALAGEDSNASKTQSKSPTHKS